MTEANSIGYLIEHRGRLSVHCEHANCRPKKFGYIDLDDLAKRLGREHSAMHWDLLPYFVCKRCEDSGRPKKIGFIHHAYTGPKDNLPAAVPRIMPPR